MALKKKKNEKTTNPSKRDFARIISPVITEKSSSVGGMGEVVVFKVMKDAKKPEIKEAIERVFQVEVDSVRTCNYLGKLKRTTRSVGRRASYKKAYVTLKPGNTIDVVEGL